MALHRAIFQPATCRRIHGVVWIIEAGNFSLNFQKVFDAEIPAERTSIVGYCRWCCPYLQLGQSRRTPGDPLSYSLIFCMATLAYKFCTICLFQFVKLLITKCERFTRMNMVHSTRNVRLQFQIFNLLMNPIRFLVSKLKLTWLPQYTPPDATNFLHGTRHSIFKVRSMRKSYNWFQVSID